MTRPLEILGDTIGAACLFAIMIGLQFVPIIAEPPQPEWEQQP